MKYAGLLFGLLALMASAFAILAFWNDLHPVHITYPNQLHAAPITGSRDLDPPAHQQEWQPTKPGAIEETVRQMLSADESIPAALSAQSLKPDSVLSPLPPSFNLNNNKDCNDAMGLSQVPPIIAVPLPEPFSTFRLPEIRLSIRGPLIEGIPYPVFLPSFKQQKPIQKHNTTKQPEETTMKGSTIALAAILGAATLATPAIADPNDDVARAVEKLDAAVRRLESVERSITDYKTTNAIAVRQVQDDMEALKSRIRLIEDDVKLIRQMVTNPSTTSKRDTTDLAPRMGRVKLTNEFVEEMSVLVNGTSYRIYPGQTRTISVTPGTFTYQVLQLQRTPQERIIAADEEKPIRIYSQRQ